MKERPSHQAENATEKKPEQFPSKEEVTSVFERFLKGKEYKEVAFRSDEHGVSKYEIETTDENGEKVEYNFQKAKYDYRDPKLPKNAQFSASIHSTTYSGEMPTGGECIANYLDGKWEYPE